MSLTHAALEGAPPLVSQVLALEGDERNVREINDLLCEATNMGWGAFKNRFVVAASDASRLTQVPIIVNHERCYISFGTADPHSSTSWPDCY